MRGSSSRPASRSVRSTAGITLFETVVALTIVSIVSISALEAVAGELRTAERSRRAIETEALSEVRLDALNLVTDQELQALPDSVKKGTFDAPLNEYGWDASATPVTGQAGVYDITLAITWPGNSYTVHSAQYRRPPVTTATR
jgi:type II secretory pathway pseudopilin PulG